MPAKLAALLWEPLLRVKENATAWVPFEFHAGPRTLPAGDYSLGMSPASGRVRLRDVRSGKPVHIFAEKRELGRSEPRLTFRCYGAYRFLWQIWLPGQPGFSLNKSDWELEVEKHPAPLSVVHIPLERRERPAW